MAGKDRERALLDVHRGLAGVVIAGDDFQDDNEARVRRGAAVVELYARLAGLSDEEFETILVDLVTDVRHFVADASLDWDYVERVSLAHFQSETTDG